MAKKAKKKAAGTKASTKRAKRSASSKAKSGGTRNASSSGASAKAKKAVKKAKTATKSVKEKAVKKKSAVAPKATKKAAKASAAKAKRTSRKVSARSTVSQSSVAKPQETAKPKPSRPSKLPKRDLLRYKRLLLEKRAQLLGDVGQLNDNALRTSRQDAAGDLSIMPIHMADVGTDNYELEFTLGLIEGERAVLKEIDEALERIEAGTFGFCLATGSPIGKARLDAKPWAKYCYEYTLAQEQGQKRGI